MMIKRRALVIVALALVVMLAMLACTAGRNTAGFVDWNGLNQAGAALMCAGPNADPAHCNGGDTNITGKLFFGDASTSTAPNGPNGSDPYYLEKVVVGGNNSHLRLTINDDADESLQVWGNSCAAGDCAGKGTKAHHFRADGATAHGGAVVVGNPNTAVDMWGFNHGLHTFNPVVKAWSHFPWVDGRNYIRGELQVDGRTSVNGPLVVNQGINDGSLRGINLWHNDDKRFGVWMSDTGPYGGKSLTGGAVADGDIGRHSVRFSTGNWDGHGFVFQNDAGRSLMSIKGDDGRTNVYGPLNVKGAGAKLCLGDTCVTEADLKALLSKGGAGGGGGGGSGGSGGLKFKVVQGYFNDNVAHFATAKVTGAGRSSSIATITTGTNGIVVANGSMHNYSVEWTGIFEARISGAHTFWISSDDASYVWIGPNARSGYTTGNANINDGSQHGMQERSGSYTMVAGQSYPIRIQFGENGGGHDCQFSFAEPGRQRTYDGAGVYFPEDNEPGMRGRYVQLLAAGQDCMNIAEVQVFNVDGTNVAAGKPVNMSSGYQGNMFPGANLVDNNTNNFAHTSCGDRGWMRIDLGSDVMISRVVVHNRADCCQNRLSGTVVKVLDANSVTVFTSVPLSADMVQELYLL